MPNSEPTYIPPDTSQIDISSAIAFMARNGVERLNLTIEAVDDPGAEPGAMKPSVAVLEHSVLADDAVPSANGLGGVFAVFEVDVDE